MPCQENGKDVSPWHDIPLRNADGTLNFVCGAQLAHLSGKPAALSALSCTLHAPSACVRAGPCVSACSLRTACATCHVPCAMCHVPRAREALAGCVSAVSSARRNAPRLKEKPASSGAAP